MERARREQLLVMSSDKSESWPISIVVRTLRFNEELEKIAIAKAVNR